MDKPLDLTPDKVKKRDEVLKYYGDRDESDLKAILKTPEGRRYHIRLLTMCRWLVTPHSKGDDTTTFKNIGIQEVGQTILAWMLDVDPNIMAQILREYRSEVVRREKELQKIEKDGDE